MALIPFLSIEQIRNKILNRISTYIPNANVADDSQLFIDADALAVALHAIQISAFSLAEEAFISYATGDRLSNLGIERGIPRKEASKASGIVRFSRANKATTNYNIPLGTQISTQPDTNGETVVFETSAGATLYGSLIAPTNLNGTTSTSGGSLSATTDFYYIVTAVDGLGNETTGSNEISITTGIGSTNANTILWDAVANASSYNVYVGSSSGTETLLTNTTGTYYVHTSGTGNGSTNVPVTNTTGATYVDVAVIAKNTGINGNVPAGAISILVDQPAGIEEVSNQITTGGGADEETDQEYRDRMQDAFISGSSQSKTTKSGYEQTALAVSGVRTATVDIPTSGAYRNEFNIYITSNETSTGLPTSTLITSVQSEVDSDENRSPNDRIIVLAPTPVNVNVQVQIISYNTSFNYTTLKDNVKANVQDFLNSLTTGADVYLVDIMNAVHDTDGVYDFTIITPTSNTTIGSTQKAIAGTITVI